jgi:hypothetical protein
MAHRRAFSNGMAAGALTSNATSRTERAGLWVRRARPWRVKKARRAELTNKWRRGLTRQGARKIIVII